MEWSTDLIFQPIDILTLKLGRRHNRQAGLTAKKVTQPPLRGGLGFRVGHSKAAAAEKPTSKLTLEVSNKNTHRVSPQEHRLTWEVEPLLFKKDYGRFHYQLFGVAKQVID